jgi:hypothetical protein
MKTKKKINTLKNKSRFHTEDCSGFGEWMGRWMDA